MIDSYEILSKIIEISNASVDVDRRLMNLANTLTATFDFALCALFLWDSQQTCLSLKFCNP
jgi:hypothetical protein